MTKRLLAILLAAVMLISVIPVFASAADYTITADSFVDADGKIAITDFTGTVGGVTFTGIKATSVEYQPDFYFTEEAVKAIKAYASDNDFNALRIYVYAICGNNAFVVNNAMWANAEWLEKDFAISEITTDFRFFSGSETTVEAYLRFEFVQKPIVNAASFTGAEFGFEDVSGNVAGREFNGVKASTQAYQPTFYLTQQAVGDIKAYAEKNGFDAIQITAVAEVYNNLFEIGKGSYVGENWTRWYFSIDDISANFPFKSDSEGAATIWLEFAFVKMPVVDAKSFADTGWSNDLDGSVFINSFAYQPHFYFSQAGIDRLKAYAAANDVDTLRIYGEYEGTNCLVLNGQKYISQDDPGYYEVKISSLTTDFDIWSQSELNTRISLKFELYKAPVISAASFNGPAFKFENVIDGTYEDVPFSGVKFTSATYQPSFYFNEQAIKDIQDYAAELGKEYLRIYSNVNIYNNCFVIDNRIWISTDSGWNAIDFKVSDLTTAIRFWSQSEGLTEGYMIFEFIDEPIIDGMSFEGASFEFQNVYAAVDGVNFKGIKAQSAAYQPTFCFKADTVEKIKAYAEANGFNTLRVNVYADLASNGFMVNGRWTGKQWTTVDIAIADLSAATTFWSQSEGYTKAYMFFEFINLPVINAESFASEAIFDRENVFDCTVADKTFDGVRIMSNAYQPVFTFTDAAIAAINAYAEENGLETVRISAYAILDNNSVCFGGNNYVANEWMTFDVPVSEITSEYQILFQSETATTLYMTFEFVHVHNYVPAVTAPTCIKSGYTTYTCSCGDSYVADETDALGHDFVDGFCTRCGLSETHEHNFVPAEVVTPSCTQDGYTLYVCTCGEERRDNIVPALGHDYVDGVCSRCGAVDPDYVAKDPCEGYTDINRSAWYHSAADYVIKNGYMGSTKTDKLVFEPNTKVSRAMVASIMYRIAGSPAAEYKASFTDVPSGKWFTTAIEWAAQNGLASGKGAGKFDPNGNVTRQELAVFMYKLAEHLNRDVTGRADLSKFADAASVPSWAKTYVQWAVDAGLISGKSNNGVTKLAPVDNATRAEFASIIMRFMQSATPV